MYVQILLFYKLLAKSLELSVIKIIAYKKTENKIKEKQKSFVNAKQKFFANDIFNINLHMVFY